MITQERIKELFTYKSGQLIRIATVSSNAIKGMTAGSLSDNGYLMVRVDGPLYRVHRLIFLYHHGYLPKYLDHINQKSTDNRIENLRECNLSQNACNSRKQERCSSRIKGVSWCKEKRLWEAEIRINKSRIRLGRFWDEETAAQVVQIARLKHHGEFANHGGAL